MLCMLQICCLRRTHSTPAQIVQSTVSLGPQSRERFPIRTADPANWAENECHGRAAVVRSNPVSHDNLCKTGIFADVAGDFCRLRPPYLQTKGPGTESKARKAGISGPFSPFLGNLGQRRNGWLGREGSNLRMVESKSTALPLGYAPTGRSGRHGTIATQCFPATSVYRGSPAVSTDNRPDFGWNRARRPGSLHRSPYDPLYWAFCRDLPQPNRASARFAYPARPNTAP